MVNNENLRPKPSVPNQMIASSLAQRHTGAQPSDVSIQWRTGFVPWCAFLLCSTSDATEPDLPNIFYITHAAISPMMSVVFKM